jgi:hypothetical protein
VARWAVIALGSARTGESILNAINARFAVSAEGASGAGLADAVVYGLSGIARCGWLRLALLDVG